MTTVWVITACRDRRAITARFLDQLVAQDHRPLRLIAVDDGSSDGTPDVLDGEDRFPVTVIRGDGRLYWGGAMAMALRAIAMRRPSDEDVVMLCNDDVGLDRGFVGTGARISMPGRMALGIGIDPADGRVIERGQVLDWRLRPRPPRDDEAIMCAPTRGLFVRWGDVRRIGNFAADRLPHYLSDYEWTLRATRRGIRIVTDPRLRLLLEPRLTGTRNRNDVHGLAAWRRMDSRTYAENPRDLARFAARVAPWPLAAVELLHQLLRWAIMPLRNG